MDLCCNIGVHCFSSNESSEIGRTSRAGGSSPDMISSEALRSARQALSEGEIDDAPVEAELLLCHVLGVSKAGLYTEPERPLSAAQSEQLQQLVRRRLAHEPTAYILGCCQFYGFDFYVDRRTLIPRPETELLVEKAVEFARPRLSIGSQLVIADIGAGCGAIAVSLALLLPTAGIYATDISAPALEVAGINCRRHGVASRVILLRGNLLEPLPGRVDVIVANLPYITDAEMPSLSPEIVNFEPALALSGGEDGLDKLCCLLSQVRGKIRPGGVMFLELGWGQDREAVSLVKNHLSPTSVELIPDMAGINRVLELVL